MTTIAFVMARGGSKGVKRKNLRTVGGVPLLGHAIMQAQAATLVHHVIVSTEDAEIAAVAVKYGAGVIDRPAELATDDAPEWLCWQHAITEYRRHFEPDMDLFVSVPCTSPLRLPEDVDDCIRALTMDAEEVITVTPARRNPWYNMVTIHPYTGWVYTAAYDGQDYERRQDAPAVYDMTTVCYVARPSHILAAPRMMMPGKTRAVIFNHAPATEIDTELDLRIADFLMGERAKAEVAW